MVHTKRGAYTRRCTQKGGLWPPQESCYLRGHRPGGTHRTRCLHKAVHTKGGLWPPRESCHLKGLRGGLCFFKGHMGWGGYRNEPAVRPADSAGRTSTRRFGRPISAGRTAAQWFGRPAGRPNRRPAVSAKFSAKILRGCLGRPISAGRTAARRFGRPSRPAEPPPSFSAEDRRRAPPPFHSDELTQAAVTRRNMRREERVTVQGPMKKPQPNVVSHRGGGLGCPFTKSPPPPPFRTPFGDRRGG